ncbi:lactate utilization protein [Ruminococcaceae bacterium OttesenSCG-928-O06]|nr:lactate utilization protein [Ruminococcaceae bacterium OttesenSCG-928-O06]
MSGFYEKYYEIASAKILQGLAARGMDGHYCATAEEAAGKALSLIPAGASVGWGGSQTILELGITERVHAGDYTVYDRDTAKDFMERDAIQRQALQADYFLMSTNAITMDGKLVNLDGMGNRLAAMIYGARNVIVVAGMNKVAPDEESAVKRVRHHAAVINNVRYKTTSPCMTDGVCHDCLSDTCLCGQLVITRLCKVKGRIKVVLFGGSAGF